MRQGLETGWLNIFFQDGPSLKPAGQGASNTNLNARSNEDERSAALAARARKGEYDNGSACLDSGTACETDKMIHRSDT